MSRGEPARSLALKLVLAPVLVAQAVATRRRAPSLPEAEGPREGRLGRGDPALRLLIAGDSSAAGVGVARQDQALAGHLSRALHRALARPLQWSLRARSGFTTQQVFALLREQPLPAADVAVVVTGVNDVIDQIPLRRALAQRAALADWLLGERGVSHVVFAPLPPVERFPLLPSPLRNVMGADAHRLDDAVARWTATRSDVSHAVIEVELGPDAMAIDGFHPGEPVYRACGEALAAHISKLTLTVAEEHR
ncbi:MAG: SGNH/GDSL hydrolase family protein [Burkholderiaceae bacterium]|nr:SGNH/GDSL hydrolase family protein [Burkholderiaceae bacterium]